MRIVLGVLHADAGTASWDGQEIDAEVRRRIGYMPEERGLYPKMKVGKQLEYLAELHAMPRAVAREAVREWTDRLGIGPRRGEEVQKLSLGNQQRVQLAAALVHEPDLLVLDEPFSGLGGGGSDLARRLESCLHLGSSTPRLVPVRCGCTPVPRQSQLSPRRASGWSKL